MPLLEAFAIDDPQTGQPCVANIGPGGAGHYVKMVHNGIEHGMQSALAEAWEMLFKCQHMKLERIADIFESWTKEGELASLPPALSPHGKWRLT
jgi:6-phosphogluconate dehydrogenase